MSLYFNYWRDLFFQSSRRGSELRQVAEYKLRPHSEAGVPNNNDISSSFPHAGLNASQESLSASQVKD